MKKINKSQKNIPNGWQAIKFKDVLTVGSGRDYKHLENGNIPVFGTGGYMLSVNKCLYSGETVFIGRKGTIDKPFYFKGDFWTVDTLFYTYNYRNTIAKYINLVFQKINWKLYNEASGVPSLSKATIEKIKFNFPPLPEQKRIVAVLEVWDEMVGKMARKIEIKKNVKKGLMQELLSGKKRLKRFSKKWASLEFFDCFYVQSKVRGEKKQDYLKEGSFPVVDQSQNKIAGYSNNQDFVIKKDLPFIIFGDHTRILKLIDFPFILGNDGTKVFQGKEKYDTTFEYWVQSSFQIFKRSYFGNSKIKRTKSDCGYFGDCGSGD
ncbi:MAG: hypothetical protein UR83_C0055G0018 [Candidatus Moranbacteria bacterium GW2011_GWF2_35_54]|nr:MAG: hypothetical protein UR83_C0055G0018 [Candidatus Moranbacteria bacterium GW2011_GWF2_35_54]